MAFRKIAITLPPDIFSWVKDYAEARRTSLSRTVADILLEKRINSEIGLKTASTSQRIRKIVTR